MASPSAYIDVPMFMFIGFVVDAVTPVIVSVLLSVLLMIVCPFHVSCVYPEPLRVIVSVDVIVDRSACIPLILTFVLLATCTPFT